MIGLVIINTKGGNRSFKLLTFQRLWSRAVLPDEGRKYPFASCIFLFYVI